jgi:hypothetical protein
MAIHNRAQLVGRAIASVRGQSFLDWEMICVAMPTFRACWRRDSLEAGSGARAARRSSGSPPPSRRWIRRRAADPDGAPPGVVYCLAYRENDATGRFAPPWRLMPRGDVSRTTTSSCAWPRTARASSV